MEIVKTNSQLSSEQSVPVTVENFTRAESDLYFNAIVQKGGFGRFEHNRAAVPLDEQDVIRLNRDTLYSAAVRDLDAGPATITPPDAGKRFMSLQLINEDQYTPMVFYGKGVYTVTKGEIGTRYVLAGIRTLADPENPQDLRDVHALKDAIRLTQENSGNLETPKWDPVSQKKVREALLVLAEGLPDTKNMFGSKDQVDPVKFLIGSPSAWGGNPEKYPFYLNVVPPKNNGKTIYRLHVKDVPVEGFWSISLYNRHGYYEPNPYNAYSLNKHHRKKDCRRFSLRTVW